MVDGNVAHSATECYAYYADRTLLQKTILMPVMKRIYVIRLDTVTKATRGTHIMDWIGLQVAYLIFRGDIRLDNLITIAMSPYPHRKVKSNDPRVTFEPTVWN